MSFGNQKFGNEPFGHEDLAEHLIFESIPDEYRRQDKFNNLPLRKFVDGIKPNFREVKDKIDDFEEIRQPTNVPIKLIDFLAQDFGFKTDSSRPDDFRRAEVRNIVELLKWKGTDKGYRIAALFENLIIEIIPVWVTGCRTSDPREYFFDPVQHKANFDEIPGDEIETDKLFTEKYIDNPNRDGFITLEETADDFREICRTHYLRIVLRDNPEFEFQFSSVQSVVDEIKEVKPIHVEFLDVIFKREIRLTWRVNTLDEDFIRKMFIDPMFASRYDSIAGDDIETDQHLVSWME